MQQSFAGLFRWYAKGDITDTGDILKTFPVPLTSVRDYVQSVVTTSQPGQFLQQATPARPAGGQIRIFVASGQTS
jgi:hypothetical protein